MRDLYAEMEHETNFYDEFYDEDYERNRNEVEAVCVGIDCDTEIEDYESYEIVFGLCEEDDTVERDDYTGEIIMEV